MPHSPELVLQLLQRFIKHPNQIKQLHSRFITNAHLLHNPHNTSSSHLKWKTTLLFNALIRAYLNIFQPHNTFLLFTHMLAHQAPPNAHTFSSLLKAASSSPSLSSHLRKTLHTQAIKRGISSDPFVQTSFLSLYAQIDNLSDARNVFDEMPEPCVAACNVMLNAFGKNGDLGSAIWLFERMNVTDVVSWTSVINGFGRNGYFAEAIRFFEKMMVDEDVMGGIVKPNEATFVSVLSSCANNCNGGGALYQGKQVHGFIIKNEIELTVFIGTALIDLYGKAGCLGYAIQVFSGMAVKEVCTWNAMISSLALNGKAKQALDTFEKMKLEGLKPNEVTFVAILAACAHSELVELGLALFQSMLHEFSIVPSMECRKLMY